MKNVVIKRFIKDAVISLPHLKAKRKKYIKYIRSCYLYPESTPTILATNCIGGMIYHNLGLKFMSPTINLWMTASDFCKFVNNLDYYLDGKLEFIKDDKDYPVAKLCDIVLYFTHYLSEEDAESKWEERKQRIDKNNLYIIADDNLSDAELLEFKKAKCKRLVVFTTKNNTDEMYFKWVGVKEKHPEYSVKDFSGFALFEKQFNYAAWLNGDKDFRIK